MAPPPYAAKQVRRFPDYKEYTLSRALSLGWVAPHTPPTTIYSLYFIPQHHLVGTLLHDHLYLFRPTDFITITGHYTRSRSLSLSIESRIHTPDLRRHHRLYLGHFKYSPKTGVVCSSRASPQFDCLAPDPSFRVFHFTPFKVIVAF